MTGERRTTPWIRSAAARISARDTREPASLFTAASIRGRSSSVLSAFSELGPFGRRRCCATGEAHRRRGGSALLTLLLQPAAAWLPVGLRAGRGSARHGRADARAPRAPSGRHPAAP